MDVAVESTAVNVAFESTRVDAADEITAAVDVTYEKYCCRWTVRWGHCLYNALI